MNNIKLKVNLNASRQLEGPHQVRINLSAWADQAEQVGGLFRALFEIEMLRGSIRRLRDGSVSYRFELDTEKATQLRQVLIVVFFSPAAN